MELTPGAVIGGKYRIERALARGGMGSLFVARHVQLGSTVALKFLDPTFAVSPAHRARFEREARSAANLKSPHVVHVQDYGFEGTSPYIVMELLEGEDLGQRLHRVRRMSLRDTAQILVQVGKALRKAHEAGITHRDLKPANLYLARVDDDEVVKILDFGIAKDQHSTLGDATRTGEVIGSPHYMSPEQVRAERDLDQRTDLWSLAIILYRMLVGVLPFPGDQLGPVLAKILTDPIPVPSHAAPDLPYTMDGFFARALARDKQQRFQSIAEMIEAFHAAAGGREAMPSISMSIGTGPIPAAGGSGTVAWNNPQAPSTITGSALMTVNGPPTGAGPMGGSGPLTGAGPMGGSGPLTGAGPMGGNGVHAVVGHTGPHTGSVTAGGFASTGAPPRSRSAGPLIALAVAAAALLGAAAVVALVLLRGPAEGPADVAAAGTTAEAAPALPSAESEPPAAASATSSAEAEPTASASASTEPAASAEPAAEPSAEAEPAASSAPPRGPLVKPKPPVKPKEKWF